MGAEEIGSMSFKGKISNKPFGNKFEPSPEAEQRYREAMEALEKSEEFDPDHFVDNMVDDRFELSGDAKSRTEAQKMEAQMKRQHQLDMIQVGIIMRALQDGIPLKDNETYSSLLEEYPLFQVKLDQRKQKIQGIKKEIEKMGANLKQEQKEARALYSFEKLKSIRNLKQVERDTQNIQASG